MHQLSDAEYIEKMRKKVNTVYRLRWFWPIMFLCYFGLFIWCTTVFDRVIPKPDHNQVWGFVFGAIMGLGFGLTTAMAGFCILHWWEAYRGWRTERLLLKYYDELQANQRGHETVVEKI
jgi:hypothetical protein